MRSKKLSKKIKSMLIALAIAIKAFLSAITPLGTDFINIGLGASRYEGGLVFYGPYTLSIYFINLFHKAWMLMPVNPKPFYVMVNSGELFRLSLNALLATFMLKLPLLVSDLLTGIMIYLVVFHLSKSKPLAFSALMLWIFNPYTTIVIEMGGTMDIISTSLLVASVLLFLKNKCTPSAILLSMATMARFYPIALFPFYLIVISKDKGKKSLAIFTSAYIVPILLVLYLFITNYGLEFLLKVYALPVTSALAVPEFTWFLGHIAYGFVFPKAPLSIVATLYVIYAFVAYRFWKSSNEILIEAILCALLSYMAFSNWHYYYTTWIIPFLTIDYALHKNKSKPGVYPALFFLFFFSTFLYDAVEYWFRALFFIPPYNQALEYLNSIMVGFYRWAKPGALFHTFAKSILAGVGSIYLAKAIFRNIGESFNFKIFLFALLHKKCLNQKKIEDVGIDDV